MNPKVLAALGVIMLVGGIALVAWPFFSDTTLTAGEDIGDIGANIAKNDWYVASVIIGAVCIVVGPVLIVWRKNLASAGKQK